MTPKNQKAPNTNTNTKTTTRTSTRWHHKLPPTVQLHHSTRPNLNPISKRLHPTHVALIKSPGEGEGEVFHWKSRNHRKNRHDGGGGRRRRSGDTLLQRIALMRHLEYWNISWWVAITFTLGSIIWVINGFYAFLPFLSPNLIPEDQISPGVGWTAWVGATIFEFGAIMGVWEAWNRDDVVHFGWAVEEEFYLNHSQPEEEGQLEKAKPPKKRRKWIWFSLETKYFHELGFLAAFVQFWVATIFWISGFTAIPTIQDAIISKTGTGLWDAIFWTPQVVGGTGFIVSSTLIMLETQTKWYTGVYNFAFYACIICVTCVNRFASCVTKFAFCV